MADDDFRAHNFGFGFLRPGYLGTWDQRDAARPAIKEKTLNPKSKPRPKQHEVAPAKGFRLVLLKKPGELHWSI